MKKTAKILAIVMVHVLSVSLLASCGGGSDALKGTWKAPSDALDQVTFTFDGGGKCTFDNTAVQQEGTYEIKDDKTVEIKLEMWDEAKTYEYVIDGDNLALTDQAGLASYSKLVKQAD